jgi:Xaa-Pro aminopeptidase
MPELAHVSIRLAARNFEDAIFDILADRPEWRAIGVEAAVMTLARYQRLCACAERERADGLRPRRFVALERAVESVRVIKDASEIEILREAGRMLSAVASEAVAFVRPGRSERDVAADVDDALRRAGFDKPAFETIVASGPNSALPHARPGGRVLTGGDASCWTSGVSTTDTAWI